MEGVNYIVKLNEYKQKTSSVVNFEEISSDGPAHIKTFTLRAVVNGQAYPSGVGNTKKEAKQNAARNALDGIETTKQNDQIYTPNLSEDNSNIPQTVAPLAHPNFICWLNEYAQKNKVTIQAIESTSMGPSGATQGCQYVVDAKEYQIAFGKTKKEAKEEAAKIVYSELCGVQDTGGVDSNLNSVADGQNKTFNQSILDTCDTFGNLDFGHMSKPHSLAEWNYIGLLNGHCQKTQQLLDFKCVDKKGPEHNPKFIYKVVIGNKSYPDGLGKTSKEAKQNAAEQAWSALQGQSDLNSQVSCSAMSIDGASSSPLSTCESFDPTPIRMMSTTSDSVKFTNSPEPLKLEEKLCSKPKIKLAANFQISPARDKKVGMTPQLTPQKIKTDSNGRTSNQCVISRFTSEFDSIERIGNGGFGRVYKAKRNLEQKDYAVKIVRSKEKSTREVLVLADLQHPNIVRYFTSWIEEFEFKCDSTTDSTSRSSSDSSTQYLYIQMELCNTTLKELIDEWNCTRLNPERRNKSLCFAKEIVCGVEYIHSKKLIHRDLKPANIMFGMDKKIKIGDFGLVTADDNDNDEDRLERTKRTGTRSYMAPEQNNQSTYDRKVDVFAFGLIYFELVWKLYTASERKEVWSDVRSVKFPKGFSTQFSLEHKLIASMLCEKPEDRPDAIAVKKELEKFYLTICEPNAQDS